MPSLMRFLFFIAVVACIVYGAMTTLVLLVEPRMSEMTERIPADKLPPPTPATP